MMICPHCQVSVHETWGSGYLGEDSDGRWSVQTMICPACGRFVIRVLGYKENSLGGDEQIASYLARPQRTASDPLPAEVPNGFAADYNEAEAVLPISPKASAALARRCLQSLLREHGGATQRDLHDQIQHVLDNGGLPQYLRNDIDAVRVIGNFAAHPIKNTQTGSVEDVEPGEAEWNLAVLRGLFDFYFVQPAAAQQRRDALNAKLRTLNRPPMRTGDP